ncbi:MAG: squalene/phytoene synthase family protein [Rhizomicrobium sp.]|nr:squalene/phytoene synthase family protein [Rhizomicrobium sp.]
MADDPFAACEESVRRHDPDRYFAALFAPEDKRRHLFVLAALYYELAHAVAVAREPMLAAIRLAWWRETVEGARAGKPRDHAVAKALVETLASHDLPQELFDAMIEGWMPREAFVTAADAEDHADATVGSLMRLGALVLGAEVEVRDAAIAYGLAGRRGGVWNAIDCDGVARAHFAAARKGGVPKAALPALMPASLVPLYLKRPEPLLWRKQITYLRVAIRGRL